MASCRFLGTPRAVVVEGWERRQGGEQLEEYDFKFGVIEDEEKGANCSVRGSTRERAVGDMGWITVARSSMIHQRSEVLLLSRRE